jgi:hypothetical protein
VVGAAWNVVQQSDGVQVTADVQWQVCSVVWLLWTRRVSPVKINCQFTKVHGDGIVRMQCVRKWCSRLKMIRHLQ